MPTTAVYELLTSLQAFDAPHDVDAGERQFATGGRLDWHLVMVPVIIPAGTSINPVFQASPTSEDDFFVTVHDFGVLTNVDEGVVVEVDVGLDEGLEWIRGRIEAITGEDVFLRLRSSSPFLDPSDPDDRQLLTKKLRTFGDGGRTRIVEEAEADILRYVTAARDGWLPLELWRTDALERMKLAVAVQAHHRFRLDQLGKSEQQDSEPTQQEAREVVQEAKDALEPLLFHEREVPIWLGR